MRQGVYGVKGVHVCNGVLMEAEQAGYGPGMSPAPASNRMQMIVTPEFLREVDDWRRLQPDIPNRSEAIRRLAMMGIRLGAADGKTKP
ncbi:MAG TPA: hypothetical protein VGV37_06520 [Aliidongia sp.]|uniref:hypothetical protein n=1 Tax=Aliidongia sp. TaxID=1914230 RepID=UPI002DDD2219|nr:hypothetical protein [Aliidongia sp.]HEV2674180.1 hypothetical protein [Aliidongia sp.]